MWLNYFIDDNSIDLQRFANLNCLDSILIWNSLKSFSLILRNYKWMYLLPDKTIHFYSSQIENQNCLFCGILVHEIVSTYRMVVKVKI